MTERLCVVDGTPLRGAQRKYCDNPECKRQGAREAWLIKTYGITLADFDTILAHQGGKCGCCRMAFKPSETPVVDHEHGKHVRGIVHDHCNRRLIGRLKSWERAQNLADYLREPPAVKALGREVIAPGRPSSGRKRRHWRRKAAK